MHSDRAGQQCEGIPSFYPSSNGAVEAQRLCHPPESHSRTAECQERSGCFGVVDPAGSLIFRVFQALVGRAALGGCADRARSSLVGTQGLQDSNRFKETKSELLVQPRSRRRDRAAAWGVFRLAASWPLSSLRWSFLINLRVCSQAWDARGTRQCPAWPWLPRAPLNRYRRAPFQDPLPGPTEAPTRQGWSWVPRLHRPGIDSVRMATRWAGLWLHGGWWGQSDGPVSVSILAKESRPLRTGRLWGGTRRDNNRGPRGPDFLE